MLPHESELVMMVDNHQGLLACMLAICEAYKDVQTRAKAIDKFFARGLYIEVLTPGWNNTVTRKIIRHCMEDIRAGFIMRREVFWMECAVHWGNKLNEGCRLLDARPDWFNPKLLANWTGVF